MKTKSPAEEFADTLRDDPMTIIKWIDSEIAEYKKLKKILEKRKK